MYINQLDAQILVNSLYFFVKWLYMFRTIISPSSGATFNKLYTAIGTCRYGVQLINPLKTNGRLLYLKTQFVPHSKHFSSRL